MKKMPPEEWIAAVLIIIMVLMVTAQVISRYMLHVSLSHTEELVRYLFVWATFIGAAGAVFRGRHLSISSGLPGLPAPVRRTIQGAKVVGALLFAGILLIFGGRIVLLQWQTGQETAALGIPMWVVGLAVPVGALLIILRIIMVVRGGGRDSR
jgi:C4-dicarboxylate transporter, DctQ subunit